MTKPRTIEVRSPSAREETLAALRLGFAIIFASMALISLRPDARDPSRDGAGLFPFQRLFADLPAAERRTFSALREALVEAENLRVSEGRWPTAAQLEALGVPPFADDPIAQGRLTWTSRESSVGLNYLGIPPPGSSARPFLLLVQDSGEPAQPGTSSSTPLDEGHRRLPGGALIHVSIWVLEGDRAPSAGVIDKPLHEGWIQILAGTDPTTNKDQS